MASERPFPPPRDCHTDCRSPEGVTVGLIDGIIATCRILRARDLSGLAVREALADAWWDEDVRALLGHVEDAGKGEKYPENRIAAWGLTPSP